MKKLTCFTIIALLVAVFMAATSWAGPSQLRSGVAAPYFYLYTKSTGTVGAYYMTIPTLVANDTFVGLATTQILTNKTLTAPTVNGGTVQDATVAGPTFTIATHDYEGAAADWSLSTAEARALVLSATNANGGCAIIAPAVAGKTYIVRNATGQNLTIKKSGGSGITIANGKTAQVYYLSSDYVRATADQTH